MWLLLHNRFLPQETHKNTFGRKTLQLNYIYFCTTTHLLLHSGGNPFSYTHCKYSCTQAVHLKTHLRTHSGEKPLTCDQFNYSSSEAEESRAKTHWRKFRVKSTDSLPAIPMVWSITCFYTPARNLLSASNSNIYLFSAFVFVYLHVKHPGTSFLRSLFNYLFKNIVYVMVYVSPSRTWDKGLLPFKKR